MSTVRTNQALNPRVTAGGPAAWQNEGASIWTITRLASGVPAHPAGITSAIRTRVTANNTNSQPMGLYNIDGLDDSAISRYAGLWVYCTGTGYQVTNNVNGNFSTVVLTANTWKWIHSTAPFTSYAGLYIVRTSGANAPTSVLCYATGLIIETTPDGAFFDGSTPNGGGKTYAWTGTAGLSSSTETTADAVSTFSGWGVAI